MAKPNTQPTKRSVTQTKTCQGWDKGTGKCGADASYSITYGLPGVSISHTWSFCKKHYGRQQRKRYGTCSYDEWVDGKRINCTSLRDTNTRGKGRGKRGYCRRHEGEYLNDAGAASVGRALDRLAGIITPDSFTGCWFTPARDTGGRSHVSLGGRKWLTYRLTYVAFFGGHAKHMELSHSCDNALCSNPLHVIPLTKPKHRVLTYDEQATNIWRIAQASREAPADLVTFAEAHDLPLYGTGTLLANALLGSDYLLADKRVALAV